MSRYETSAPREMRRTMLERVSSGAHVLDFGCWSGAIGEFLMTERGCIVDGIELDRDAAAQAAQRYRDVRVGRIEDELQSLVAGHPQGYDCLLFLDVLEHLVDPASVLRAARDLIRPGGMALMSIPNIAHWTIRLALARGRWRYEDSGLMDRTHLRFFTQQSTDVMVRDAGWRVNWRGYDVDARPLIAPGRLSHRLLRRVPRLFAVQLLYEIAPGP